MVKENSLYGEKADIAGEGCTVAPGCDNTTTDHWSVATSNERAGGGARGEMTSGQWNSVDQSILRYSTSSIDTGNWSRICIGYDICYIRLYSECTPYNELQYGV